MLEEATVDGRLCLRIPMDGAPGYCWVYENGHAVSPAKWGTLEEQAGVTPPEPGTYER